MLRSARTGDRVGGVERDVRGQGGQDLHALHRVPGGDALVSRQANRTRPAGARSKALPVAVRSCTRRFSCSSCARTVCPRAAESVVSSSSPFTARSDAAVEQSLDAAAQDGGGVVRVGLPPLADEQDCLDVSLGERSLACRNLDDRRVVARARGRTDRKADAQRGEEREDDQDRSDRAAAARRERVESRCLPRSANRPHRQCTTNVVRMPAMKCPDMLQKRT